MTKEVNIFNLCKQPWDLNEQTFEVKLIKNLTSEHHDEIELESKCEFEFETKISNIDQIIDSAIHWASNPISLNPEPRNSTLPSTDSFSPLELKAFPNYLKYAYLCEKETLSIILHRIWLNGWKKAF